MCPLRVILIFLSATLAGFFVLRGLRAQPAEAPTAAAVADGSKETITFSGKVRSAICLGFWTCVDLASGRYLWSNLVSSPAAAADSSKKL